MSPCGCPTSNARHSSLPLHSQPTAPSGRSARRPSLDRSLGRASGELYAAVWVTSVRFRRRFRGWSRVVCCCLKTRRRRSSPGPLDRPPEQLWVLRVSPLFHSLPPVSFLPVPTAFDRYVGLQPRGPLFAGFLFVVHRAEEWRFSEVPLGTWLSVRSLFWFGCSQLQPWGSLRLSPPPAGSHGFRARVWPRGARPSGRGVVGSRFCRGGRAWSAAARLRRLRHLVNACHCLAQTRETLLSTRKKWVGRRACSARVRYLCWLGAVRGVPHPPCLQPTATPTWATSGSYFTPASG